MRLINCYHPKVIVNKYTHCKEIVSCGKCPACLNTRAADWVTRLDQEMLQHRYTFFGTLQFDEQHVKQLVLLSDLDSPSNLPSYIDISTGEVFSLGDVSSYVQADIDYCYNTKYLLVHDVKLYQDFLKRLRKSIYERFPDVRLRYYIGLEYGPQTFRPHAHSLFFFDSSLLAKDFARLCSESWQNGNSYDFHPVSGSASQYVAGYVNSFASLPAIYSHPRLRQKALFSKCPSIGTFAWTEETFKRLFDSSALEMSIFRKSISEFSDVSLWRNVQYRLYPKIVGFDRLSNVDRNILYSLGFRFIEDGISSFAKDGCPSVSEVNLMYLANFLAKPYWHNIRDLFVTKSRMAHSTYYNLNENSLRRFISAVSMVCRRCLSWNISVSDYVTKIEHFYENLNKKKLREYYHLQDEYFKSHPISDFLCLFPDFCLSVYNKLPSQLESWQRFYIETYMPHLLLRNVPIRIQYTNCDAFKSLKGLHDKIAFDNTKQKKSNDYLLAHKDKFNNIISYNQQINSYVESKTF